MHILSSILARNAQKAWREAYEAHAEIGFPLGVNLPARVLRLRGYGDGIVSETAKAFIESFSEATGLVQILDR